MRNDFGVDQADGLRRLLGSSQTWVVALAAGKSGVGCTSVSINLAAALARSGKDVLVLDEHEAPNNVPDRLGLNARHDLLDVVQGKCKLDQAVLSTGGFSVLGTARAMHALSGFDPGEQQRLESALTEVGGGVDVMLVDAAMPAGPAAARMSGHLIFSGTRNEPCTVSLISARGTALLVVVDATASGITESYALIKRLALENARLQFGIVVNKVADEQAARTVFENMAKLARRNLAARLEYLGCIPRDEKLKRATQLGKPVVEAFPAAVSTQTYMGLAHRLMLVPMCQDVAENGVRTVMRELMRQASQPLQRFSREIEQVVN